MRAPAHRRFSLHLAGCVFAIGALGAACEDDAAAGSDGRSDTLVVLRVRDAQTGVPSVDARFADAGPDEGAGGFGGSGESMGGADGGDVIEHDDAGALIGGEGGGDGDGDGDGNSDGAAGGQALGEADAGQPDSGGEPEPPPARCGDGHRDAGEACDDGNRVDGDGCDGQCREEAPADVSAGGDFDGGFGPGGRDSHALRLLARSRVTAETSDGRGGCPGDTRIRFEAAGRALASDDDGGAGTCSRLQLDLDAGDYTIVVDGFAGAAVGAYVLSLEIRPLLAADDPCDPNDPGPLCPDGTGCVGAPGAATCAPVCGDGLRVDPEACDDGNLEPGDGCDAECGVEPPPDVSGSGDFPRGVPEDGANTFELSVARRSELVVHTSDGADGCPGDTVMDLGRIDPATGEATSIASDDDGGIGLCSRLTRVIEPGDYVIEVRHRRGQAIARYVLSVAIRALLDAGEGCDLDADQPADQLAGICPAGHGCLRDLDGVATCAPVCGDGVVVGPEACDDGNVQPGDGCDPACQIEPPPDVSDGGDFSGGFGEGDFDVYALTLDGPAQVTAETMGANGGCPGDTIVSLHVFDPASGEWAEVAENDDGGRGLCSLLSVRLEAGEYRFEVRGYQEQAVGAYVLRIDVQPIRGPGDACVPDVEHCPEGYHCDGVCAPICGDGQRLDPEECDDGNAAFADGCAVDCRREIDLGESGDFEGMLGVGETRWFNLTLARETQVSLTVTGPEDVCPGDAPLALFALEGGARALVAESEALAGCGEVATRLGPGTYQVRVDNAGEVAFEPYVLRVELIAALEIGAACDVAETGGFCPTGAVCESLDDDTLTCVTVCGDGIVAGDEACDDGNSDGGDGCDARCRVEADFIGQGGQREGGFEPGDSDVWTLAIATPSRVIAYTSGGDAQCPGDTEITLRRVDSQTGEATVVADDDDGGEGLCSRIDVRLEPGDYTIEVGPFVDVEGIASYVLTVEIIALAGLGEACEPGTCIDGYVCAGEAEPSCAAICGDALVVSPEICDDGNTAFADGCAVDCRTEIDVTGGGSFEDALAPGEHRWFNLDLAREARITVDLTGADGACPVEAAAVLFAIEAGARLEVGRAGDGDHDECPDAFELLGAGRYQIRVDNTGDAALDPYALLVAVAPALDVDEPCAVDEAGGFCPTGTACGPDGVEAPTCLAICGDGIVLGDEQCDDGATEPGDGCDPGCVLEADIGPGGGVVDGGFGRDDYDEWTLALDGPARVIAFTSDGDNGCPGDTVLTMRAIDPETGDESVVARNDDDRSGRFTLCSRVDIRLEAGEYTLMVEAYGENGIDAYVLTVRVIPVVELGDDCDAAGEITICGPGTACVGGVCGPVCGDGVVTAPEICDDGNGTPGDGCDEMCRIEGVTLGGVFPGGFEADGENVYPINVDGPSVLFAQTSDGADGCPGDTVMSLVRVGPDGAVGELVVEDDDGGAAPCSAILETVEPGRYAIVVRGAEGAAIPDYVLGVELVADMTGGGRARGGFVAGDYDRVWLQMPRSGQITMATSDGAGGCPGDTRISIAAIAPDTGERLGRGENDDGGISPCSRLTVRVPAGPYEIVVSGFGGRAIGHYFLDVSVEYDTDIGAGGDFAGGFGRDEADWYVLRLDEPTRVRVETTGADGECPGDTRLTSWTVDAAGVLRRGESDDSSGARLCSLLELDLAPGEHHFQVEGFFGGAIADYVLRVSFP